MKKIAIIVSKNGFPSIERAAYAEEKVEWFKSNSDADACTECFAAMELRNHLRQMRYAVYLADDLTRIAPGSTVIVIGTTASSSFIRENIHRLGFLKLTSPDGYAIRAVKIDGLKVVLIAGKSRVGVLYGTYRYLEELGVRWPDVEPKSTVIPKTCSIWYMGLYIYEQPHFEIRGFESESRGSMDIYLWMARNRINYYSVQPWQIGKKLGFKIGRCTHIFQEVFDPERKLENGKKLFDVHPDWFPLRNGSRVREIGHPCLCKSAAVDFILDETLNFMKQHNYLDYFTFGPPDTWKEWCKCDGCKRLGNASDRYMMLVHRLRTKYDELIHSGKLNHDMDIVFMVYEGSDTFMPPSKPLPRGFDIKRNVMVVYPINRCYAHPLVDADCLEFNVYYERNLRGWQRAFRGRVNIGEYYNVSQYCDMSILFSQVMDTDIKGYAKRGITGVHYMHVPSKMWGMRALTNVQFARMLWNPKISRQEVFNDYLKSRYGELAKNMAGLYNRVEQSLANITAIKSWLSGSLSKRLVEIFNEGSGNRSQEQLFCYEHLGLNPGDRPQSIAGLGLNNMSMIESELRGVLGELCRLPSQDLSSNIKRHIREDIKVLSYTTDIIALHHAMAGYWWAGKRGDSSVSIREKRDVQNLGRKLNKTIIKWGTLDENSNALDCAGLRVPYKKITGE